MTVEKLLGRLDKVKQTGARKWQACCPAHEDRGPSLAIKEEDDGRILIHCFAGCSAEEVLNSMGLNFADLFCSDSHQAKHRLTRVRNPWSAVDILSAMAFEVLVAWNSAQQMLAGKPLSQVDQDRLRLAASRLLRGLEICTNE